MFKKKYSFGILLLALLSGVLVLLFAYLYQKPDNTPSNQTNPVEGNENVPIPKETPKPQLVPTEYAKITEPIIGAVGRIKVKPFGIFVTPGDSPVANERFSGYHSGTDFETTETEKGVEAPIFAICSGKILVARAVDGYGGVLIQACHIDNHEVRVLYGHVNLNSRFTPKIGTSITQGSKIAVLGEVGPDTDNERKHLHLGIHKGSQIEYRGYVEERAELSEWLDISKYLVK